MKTPFRQLGIYRPNVPAMDEIEAVLKDRVR
jgi:hypothetical protein